jgi:hypothetical protein
MHGIPLLLGKQTGALGADCKRFSGKTLAPGKPSDWNSATSPAET